MSKFTYKGDKLYSDGKEFTIISGSIHYFRVPPELWKDRLQKLKACGFNTLETYVCWNNCFNLERYYNAAGPQKSLYIPSPLKRRWKRNSHF